MPPPAGGVPRTALLHSAPLSPPPDLSSPNHHARTNSWRIWRLPWRRCRTPCHTCWSSSPGNDTASCDQQATVPEQPARGAPMSMPSVDRNSLHLHGCTACVVAVSSVPCHRMDSHATAWRSHVSPEFSSSGRQQWPGSRLLADAEGDGGQRTVQAARLPHLRVGICAARCPARCVEPTQTRRSWSPWSPFEGTADAA